MSFLRKLLGMEQECVVPENCFRLAYYKNHDCSYRGYIQTLGTGAHCIPKEWNVTPAISYGEQVVSAGSLCHALLPQMVYYRSTVKYRITNPYMFMTQTYEWNFISAHVADLIWPLLYASRKNDLNALYAEDYQLNDEHARIVFKSLEKKLGIEVITASFRVISKAEMLSGRYVERERDHMGPGVKDLESIFENTVNPNVNI